MGKEDRTSAERMKNGESAILIGYGQSMTLKLQSGQPTVVEPIAQDMILKKGDIVFCKVKGSYYLHLVSAIKGRN